VEPSWRRKERKTQDYKAKHSEDESRIREELVGNKISEQSKI
jgi:hypothetical protein